MKAYKENKGDSVMKREIKFRGLRKDGKGWVGGKKK